jgi:hypothetical protein
VLVAETPPTLIDGVPVEGPIKIQGSVDVPWSKQKDFKWP